jgi:endonuclease/exonuclease/phosphatase (EEP) superfamily protein YafD
MSAVAAVAERIRPWALRLLLPSWAARKRMLTWQAWLVVGAAYAAVAFAWLFPQDFTNETPGYVRTAWTAFVIRTFLFHLGMVVASAGAVALLLRRRWLLLATLPLTFFALGPAVWSYVPRAKPAIAGETVRVLSANLLQTNEAADAIITEVLAVHPDIIVFQEYATHWHTALAPALAREYPHARHVVMDGCFGVAVYSRRPLQETPQLQLGRYGLPQMRLTTQISGRTVALYNVHLMPPQGVAHTCEQRAMFRDLCAQLRRETRPFIICGDFNFTGDSAYADELRRLGIRDAHDLSGTGRGTTWPVIGPFRYVPGLRLDHVYLSGELTSSASRTGYGQGSDHRPVVAEVGFP